MTFYCINKNIYNKYKTILEEHYKPLELNEKYCGSYKPDFLYESGEGQCSIYGTASVRYKMLEESDSSINSYDLTGDRQLVGDEAL